MQYVVVRQDGRLEWEPGENRCIHVPTPGLAAALAAAKQQVAAEDAAAGSNGARRPLSPPGRRLSPAEVYERQEASEQLEPWQQVAQEEAAQQAQHDSAQRAQQQSATAAAQQQRSELQQQRLAALSGSNGNGAAPAASPAVPAKKQPANVREVKFTTSFKADFGTFLKVVGGPEQMGGWEVEQAPPLQWHEGDEWTITLMLPPGKHEFKVRPGGEGGVHAGGCAGIHGLAVVPGQRTSVR